MKKILLSGMAVTLLALACGEEDVTPNVDYRLVPTSPRAALVNVETAFNRGDINLLKAMLSENFVFYFDPDDVGQHPPGGSNYVIPESWTYTEFIRAAENLFQKAHAISMEIAHDQVGTPGPEATTFRAEEVNVQLLVMIDEINGYLGEGHSDFEFEKYPSKSGAYYWHLTKWWDNSAFPYDANPGVEPTSLGRVLAFYYQ